MHKFLLLYSWFIFLVLSWLPDQPVVMRFRGWLLSFGMESSGTNLQVSSTAIIRGLQNLTVGSNVYIAPGVIINAIDRIVLSEEVMIGFNSVLVSGNHTVINGSFRFGPSKKQPIKIGPGVWIAANCTVTAGSIIGEGTIVAGNSLVKNNLEKSSIYAGVPAIKVKDLNA